MSYRPGRLPNLRPVLCFKREFTPDIVRRTNSAGSATTLPKTP